MKKGKGKKREKERKGMVLDGKRIERERERKGEVRKVKGKEK